MVHCTRAFSPVPTFLHGFRDHDQLIAETTTRPYKFGAHIGRNCVDSFVAERLEREPCNVIYKCHDDSAMYVLKCQCWILVEKTYPSAVQVLLLNVHADLDLTGACF